MKIQSITLSMTRKMPIEGVAYSNKEASFSITVEPTEGEEVDTKKIWEDIRQEVEYGLREEVQNWQDSPALKSFHQTARDGEQPPIEEGGE